MRDIAWIRHLLSDPCSPCNVANTVAQHRNRSKLCPRLDILQIPSANQVGLKPPDFPKTTLKNASHFVPYGAPDPSDLTLCFTLRI